MGFRQARLKAGRSVGEVMEELNVSDAAVYCWETGAYRPRTNKLIQLARFYGCSIEELLTDNSVAQQESNKTD